MSSIATVVQSFKWYIFLAVLCTAFDVVAQESTVEKQYDSIAQLLSNTKNEDSIAHYIKFQKGLVENATDKKKLFAVVMKSAASATRGSRAMQAHLETGYALAKEIQDSIALNEATIRLARVFQVKNDYTKALKFANESIKISEAISNDEALIEAYATRANIYNNISQIVEAIKDLNTAKKIAFQLPDNEKMLIPLLKTKSYIQYSNNQYEAGLQTLDEIIAFYSKIDDHQKSSIWRNNKAMIHISCECVPVAARKQNLLSSIKSATKANFEAGKAYAYVHLARVYKAAKNLDSAYYYLEKASAINLDERSKRFKGYLNQTKGDYWGTKKNSQNAITYFEKAYKVWDELNVLKDKQYTAKVLSFLYNETNNPKRAYKYLETYNTIKDSAFSKKNIEQIKELQLSYEFEKQQYKDSIQNAEALAILDLKRQNELQEERHIQQILLGLFVLALALGGFTYYAYQRKKKTSQILDEKNKIIEKALQEKQLLLKEVHHRVKNNFQIVSSLLELQTKGIEDEKALNLANEGKNRVKSMALIHQKLYQNETGLIDFDEYIKTLVKELSYMYASEKKVQTNIQTENVQFDIDTAIPLGLIVNELITNAYKYAFDAAADNELNISINKLNEDEYKLVVSDNGKGFDDAIDLSKVKSLGLRLVRRLTKQLQGDFLWNNQNGATFEIIFKDTQKRALLD